MKSQQITNCGLATQFPLEPVGGPQDVSRSSLRRHEVIAREIGVVGRRRDAPDRELLEDASNWAVFAHNVGADVDDWQTSIDAVAMG
jgi:hypothetical protein